MTAQDVVRIWQENIAWTENGKKITAKRKIVNVRESGKGLRSDHILIFSDQYYLDRLVMVFALKGSQWFYLGHAHTNTGYEDLECKTQTFENSEDWILTLSWRTTGTGMVTQGVVHYLVGSQGVNKLTSYPRSGHDVASSTSPFAVVESYGDTLIKKDNVRITFTDDVIVKYYLHNEDPNEILPIIDLRQSVRRVYDLNTRNVILSPKNSRFLGKNKYSVSLIDENFLKRHIDEVEKMAKKMRNQEKIRRFKLFLDYFPDSGEKNKLCDIINSNL